VNSPSTSCAVASTPSAAMRSRKVGDSVVDTELSDVGLELGGFNRWSQHQLDDASVGVR
jgi:hypothetical protein